MKSFRILAPLASVAFLVGCAKTESNHDHAAPAGHAHVHVAPHGGTLVELGEHAYSLEFVREVTTGKLSAYVLDAHAENFIRVKSPSLEVTAIVGAEQRPLTFKAVANPATGETVGDTSQFDVEADWLKTTTTFDARLVALEIRGTRFAGVPFNFPKGNPD